MSEQDIVQYLSSRRFTVLFSGGKDSLATLLWVLNNIKHTRYNIVYVEIPGNTHPECTRYVMQVCKDLGVYHKLIIARRNDLDFFDCLERWGIPLYGVYRWCMHQFKRKVVETQTYFVQVSGIRIADSHFRVKRQPIEYFKMSRSIGVFPLLFWSTKEVLEYIKANDIQLNPCYARYGHSGNCMFCPYHNKKQIILTMQDPEWRHKILTALYKQRPKGNIRKKILARWLKYSRYTTLSCSHFSEKCKGDADG